MTGVLPGLSWRTVESVMACRDISEGVQRICLQDPQAPTLGAIPKVSHKQEEAKRAETAVSDVNKHKKKNRKDRRRCELDSADNKPALRSKVQRLRDDRQQQVMDGNRELVTINTNVKNLPDSFFSDDLSGELLEEAKGEKEGETRKDFKKRKRRRQKRKQISTETEDENFVQDKLNDKLIEDDPGEEIVTNFGDAKCVVSYRICIERRRSKISAQKQIKGF